MMRRDFTKARWQRCNMANRGASSTAKQMPTIGLLTAGAPATHVGATHFMMKTLPRVAAAYLIENTLKPVR
jgi:hypothetical protein